MSLFIVRLMLLVDLWLTSTVVLVSSQAAGSREEFPILKVSQCFKSRIIPKVVFGCQSSGHMIRIVRAFHGLRPRPSAPFATSPCAAGLGAGTGDDTAAMSQADPACSYCEGDCIDDSINEVYDWSSCIGGTSCMRTVLQSYIHSCPGRDKFSEYLHVEYQCIPRDTTVNICSDAKRVTSFGGDITSPNYPVNYPTNHDCSCSLRADDTAVRIVLSFYDLFLETKNGRCRADWLMLLQDGEKHRHCGVITSGTKNMTTANGEVTLQFHSNAEDHLAMPAPAIAALEAEKSGVHPYKGFWVHFEAEDRKTPVSVVCRSLQPNDPAVLEARLDSLDDDVTSGLGNSGGFGIHHEQNEGIMTNAFGPSIDHNDQVGRATVKRLDGDDVTRAEAMDVLTTVTSSTERDTRQLGDESVPPSKKQPGRANEATEEKRLLPSLSSSAAVASHHILMRLLVFLSATITVITA